MNENNPTKTFTTPEARQKEIERQFAEDQEGNTEAEPTNGTEPTNPENQTEQIDHWANLETARGEYIEQYQEFLRGGRLGRLRNALGLAPARGREMPPELRASQERYGQAKQRYAQNEWENSSENLPQNLPEAERNRSEAEIINKIYNITVLDESDYLEEARAGAFSPFQKGVLTNAYDRWTGLSRTQRVIYSTVMVAGVTGFASLAVPVTATAAAIGMGGIAGKKLLRGTFGALMLGLSGRVYDRATQNVRRNIEQTATETTEDARRNFDINNLTAMSERYQEAIRQEERGNRNVMFGKIAVMGATGVGATVGLGALDNYVSSTGGGSGEGSAVTTREGNSSEGSGHEIVPKVEPIPEKVPVIEPYTVQKGDSVWKIAEKQLEEKYGDKFLKLNDTQKIYVIDTIKDKVANHPEDYGLTNANELKIGQQLDLSKAFPTNQKQVDTLFEETTNLSETNTTNTSGYKTPQPEILKVQTELDKTINDVHDAQKNLTDAQNQLETLKNNSSEHLGESPEEFEIRKNENSYQRDINQQEKVIREMEEKLSETKNHLAKNHQELNDMLLETAITDNKSLETTTRLGLAKIAFVEGNKEMALKLFEQATQNASAITNSIDRVNAFTKVAIGEISVGLIENAKSTFDFAERAVGAIKDPDLTVTNYLEIANQEALSGLTKESTFLLDKTENLIEENTNITSEKYSEIIKNIRNIIKR